MVLDDTVHPQVLRVFPPIGGNCTASLIASNVVLTAAHCTDSNADALGPYDRVNGTYGVDLGGNASNAAKAALLAGIGDTQVAVAVTNSAGLLTHPDYVDIGLAGLDVALLVLPDSVPRCAMTPLRVADEIPTPPIISDDAGTFFAWFGLHVDVFGAGRTGANCTVASSGNVLVMPKLIQGVEPQPGSWTFGVDPVTGVPTGEIWFTALAEPLWGRVGTGGYVPERVLAATYSFATDDLYVLDETTSGDARLAAVHLRALDTTIIGTWPRHDQWQNHSLVVDRDGAILLASSREGKKREHRIARLDVRAGLPPAVDGIAKAARPLLLPPIVDGSGYSLLLDQSPGNERIKMKRSTSLHLKPGTLADLGKQL